MGSAALLGHSVRGAPIVLALMVILWHGRMRILRRFRGWRWEFWPPWLAYLPVVPYLLYLGFKHRSLTLFTAANPGIPSGGFVGESKSAILARLPRVPAFRVVRPGETVDISEFPVVLKPDVGERGNGVTIARSGEDVRRYLATASRETIVQEYVGGLEFGAFYYRRPGESTGHILSITEKQFPDVVGDGRFSIPPLLIEYGRYFGFGMISWTLELFRMTPPPGRERKWRTASREQGNGPRRLTDRMRSKSAVSISWLYDAPVISTFFPFRRSTFDDSLRFVNAAQGERYSREYFSTAQGFRSHADNQTFPSRFRNRPPTGARGVAR